MHKVKTAKAQTDKDTAQASASLLCNLADLATIQARLYAIVIAVARQVSFDSTYGAAIQVQDFTNTATAPTAPMDDAHPFLGCFADST